MSKLALANGEFIAYQHLPGKAPGVIFFPGFHSDMSGNKAIALEQYCKTAGRQFTRFDYFGHGQSSGDIEFGTISIWLENCLAILDTLTTGPQVIVGSSMGGWLMLLCALARPGRIAGLLGIAPAVDMTERQKARLNPEQQEDLTNQGWCDLPNSYDDGRPYRLRQALFDDANRHLLLKSVIPIDIPVRLLHGMADVDIHWQHSVAVLDRLRSNDATVQLVKGADHRLSSPENLRLIENVLSDLLQKVTA
jgi:pimeloyl-ACP methyl ester carboxylesterase